jgi:HEAT repeat protein
MRLPDSYHLAAEVLQNSSDTMRSSAVWAMYSQPDAAMVPILALALRAQDSEIRALALEALGATEAPEAIPVVKSAMKDGDPAVQYAATLSWVELARESSFSELVGWIQETRGWSRTWILRGFFHATNYMGMRLDDLRMSSFYSGIEECAGG